MAPPTSGSDLLTANRVGVLCTVGAGGPFASHVPFVAPAGWPTLIVYLSDLAQHTRNLHQTPSLALCITEPDAPDKNPLSLQRLILQGRAERLTPDTEAWHQAQTHYLSRFPQAEMLTGLQDFRFWALRMQRAQLISGFAQTYVAEAASPEVWTHVRPDRPPAP